MSDASAPMLIWTDARRVPLAKRLIDELGDVLSVCAVGGPRRGEVAELAEHVQIDAADDLRQMRLDHPSRHILLTSAAGVKRDDIAAALADGVTLFTLEPLGATVDVPLHQETPEPQHGQLIQLPLLRWCPAYIAAAEPTQAIAQAQAANITSIGKADDLSLFARLADAMDFAIHLIGVPDQIDATLTGGLVEPPEHLRGLAGHMTVNLHAADQAGATLCVSDRSPIHHRSAIVVGRTGVLTMDDHRYALHTESDEPLDQFEGDRSANDTASLVALQLRYHLSHALTRDAVDRRTIIGCCQTALLSTRTGQSESTERILRIA
jgi:hypothetical protein